MQSWVLAIAVLSVGSLGCTAVEHSPTAGAPAPDSGGAGYNGSTDTGGGPGDSAATADDGSSLADTVVGASPDTASAADAPPTETTDDAGDTAAQPLDAAADTGSVPDPCADHCANGTADCDEQGTDCGGSCAPCSGGCGDGLCAAGETTCGCPGDCGVACGDGCCGPSEVASICCGDCGACCAPPDCPPCSACASSTCDAGLCGCAPSPGCCGNGACDGDESTATCPTDCPVTSNSCIDCAAGEACVLGTCAPVATLRTSPDVAPSFSCPTGTTLAGRWRAGPGQVDGNVEAVDAEGLVIDAGWAWLCSAAPLEVRVLVKDSDCGGPTSACDGDKRGSFHVGQGCGTTAAVDAEGVPLEAGWLTLCVTGAHAIRVEVAADDCGNAEAGCGGLAARGQWHTVPAACDAGITGDGASGAQIATGFMALCVDTHRHMPADPSTLAGKALFGYQGWFGAAGDGSQVGWMHWSPGVPPAADNADFDLWPDTTELGPDELFATAMTLPGGAAASVFSSHHPKTVERHFRWMEEVGIDGVFLQRFTSELTSPPHKAFRDTVTQHVRAGAEAHGRAWAIMIDISGTPEAVLVETIQQDWAHLVEDLKVTESPFYLREGGRPVLGLWGLGFDDRPGTPAQAALLLDWLQSSAPAHLRAHVVGGVPFWWRTGASDSKPGFASIYAMFDTVSPWAVGRFGDTAGFDTLKKQVMDGDATQTKAASQGYAPVVWPGFSWANLTQSPASYNQIPRAGGTFFWHQVKGMLAVSPTFLFVAMFDEVDEGTAMFKAAASAADLPTQGTFLHLGADGWDLPSDWYLRLGGAAAKAAAGQLKAKGALPYQP